MSSATARCNVTGGAVRHGMLRRGVLAVLLAGVVISAMSNPAWSQMLNWEGQTGVFVTPLAYTVPSNSGAWVSKPVFSIHYLDAGEVLGGFNQVSSTLGVFQRIEFGYTRSIHYTGSTAGVSELWSNGFNIFHAKLNMVPENAGGQDWLPSISVGFVGRTGVRNVGGALAGHDTYNQDFYAVATKTLSQLRAVPLVLSFGFKATNASLLGIAGNAPAYQGRMFGAVAIPFKGPWRSTIMLASEVLQEPRGIQGLPGAVIPTTLTYAVRIIPGGAYPASHGWREQSPRLSIDLGVAQAAGTILPGVNLHARNQFALGISYGF
jgi:hypothetical protein